MDHGQSVLCVQQAFAKNLAALNLSVYGPGGLDMIKHCVNIMSYMVVVPYDAGMQIHFVI